MRLGVDGTAIEALAGEDFANFANLAYLGDRFDDWETVKSKAELSDGVYRYIRLHHHESGRELEVRWKRRVNSGNWFDKCYILYGPTWRVAKPGVEREHVGAGTVLEFDDPQEIEEYLWCTFAVRTVHRAGGPVEERVLVSYRRGEEKVRVAPLNPFGPAPKGAEKPPYDHMVGLSAARTQFVEELRWVTEAARSPDMAAENIVSAYLHARGVDDVETLHIPSGESRISR